MQEALYYKDNYLKEFDAKVQECIKENDKYMIVLNQTAFYPEGGGQPSDKGTIDDINVIDVQEKENKIYHIIEKEIEVGKIVSCKIDFEKRFNNMQHHTAEHIVSGLICLKYNATNVGFHMGKDCVTMDFNLVLNQSQINEIEKEANEAIYKNIDIIEKIVSEKEAEKIEYRSKKKLTGNIRLIEIPGYDICACCGIHVNKTGEIGIIKILFAEKYKSGTRVYMICGKKALENYIKEYEEMNKLSVLLSAKHEDIYTKVNELKEEIKCLKIKNNVLQKELFEKEIEDINIKDINILFKENLDMNNIKNLCQLLKNKSNKVAGVFSKENDSYKYMLMSDKINVAEISEKFNKELNGKGGGMPNLVQGQILACKEQIIEILKNV